MVKHKKLILCFFGLMLAVGLIYARFIEPNRIKIETVTIQSEKLPNHFPGLKIVQLSDLHIKRPGSREKRTIKIVNDLKPDLIVITGDFIYHNIAFSAPNPGKLSQTLDEIVRWVSQLKARYGVWSVRGNNEFSDDKEISNDFMQRMEMTGNRVLANQCERLDIEGIQLFLLGVDDPQFDDYQVADFYVEKQDETDLVYYAGFSEKNSYSHFYCSDMTGWHDYVYSGRMMLSTLRSGIGVTFYSHLDRGYDRFYRLRRYQQEPSFHFSPHGTKITGGNIDTGILPECDTWYLFKIQVENRYQRTWMKAKVWQQGRTEPTDWQAIAYDDSPSRLKNGTVGLWSAKHGHHYFDDLSTVSLWNDKKVLMQEDFKNYSVGKDAANWVDYGRVQEAIPVLTEELPDSVYKILLAHSPDFIYEARDQEIDLVLSGHTHGGQINFPFLGAIFTHTKLGKRYASGLFRFDNTYLYVNKGLGTIFLPMRFLSPPEITVINLQSNQ